MIWTNMLYNSITTIFVTTVLFCFRFVSYDFNIVNFGVVQMYNVSDERGFSQVAASKQSSLNCRTMFA